MTTTDLNTTLVENIAKTMTDKGIALDELASAIGLDSAALRLRLDGKLPLTINVLYPISQALGVSMADLGGPSCPAPRSVRMAKRDPDSMAEQTVDHAWSVWESASATAPGPLLAVLRDAVWALEDALDGDREFVGTEVVAVAQAVVSVDPWM